MAMLGEIRMFSYGQMPGKYWMPCDGQLLQIYQNPVFYSLIGNIYGGDGRKTFALPDLRGRVPVNRKTDADMGKKGGEEKHALTAGEMPKHSHPVYGSNETANSVTPTNNLWANGSGQNPFMNEFNQAMSPDSISFTGKGEPHENMSPFMGLNFGIWTGSTYTNREGTIGEIAMIAGRYYEDNYQDWLPCEGQELPISGSQLFSLIGTYYGGNGTTTFMLPDLRGVAAIQCGQGKGLKERELGKGGGSETVTLTTGQLAEHNHQALATDTLATSDKALETVWAATANVKGSPQFYGSGDSLSEMGLTAIWTSGGDKPHNNMPPYLEITFMICVNGKFPHRP